jgi:hypothetical protein
MHRDPNLVEIVQALRSRRGLADFLHRGQEHGDQDADDGDHHQQLNESEAAPTCRSRKTHVGATLSVRDFPDMKNGPGQPPAAQIQFEWSRVLPSTMMFATILGCHRFHH